MNKSEVFQRLFNKEKTLDLEIKNVSINSRELEKNDVFVAIRGGNNFVDEALEKGAVAVYDSEAVKIDEKYADRAFFVKDSVEFLQNFAREWRKNLDIKVIGITGSNGKTTVKDMIYHLLSQKYKGKKTEGNYNNHIGLPFTLLRAEKDDEFIILEMGMSGFGEIDLLGQIALPNINVITNIGESHLEFLKTKENVFLAKTEIIPYIKDMLVINGDDEYLKNVKAENIEVVRALSLENNKFKEKTSDFYYGDVHFNESGTEFFLKYFGKICQSTVERNYKTNVLGEHNVLNLVMAIAVAKQFGMEDKIIGEAVKNIGLTGMRFQIIENGKVIKEIINLTTKYAIQKTKKRLQITKIGTNNGNIGKDKIPSPKRENFFQKLPFFFPFLSFLSSSISISSAKISIAIFLGFPKLLGTSSSRPIPCSSNISL